MSDTDLLIAERKQALREQARMRRSRMPQADRGDAAKFAAAHFFGAVPLKPGQVVACYWPIRDEIDCKPVMTELVDSGQPVCLPVVVGDDMPLEMRMWEPGAALYPSGFGTLAPSELAPRAVPDVLIIPLLGFDRQGTRLGYGRGYYDRTLAGMETLPLVVGMAFAIQELDEIPRDPHDVPVDVVITEDGATVFDHA